MIATKRISKLYVASDRISIRIIVFLRWVRLGLHNGGRALQLGRLGGRALRLEQARGPSAAARAGQGAECWQIPSKKVKKICLNCVIGPNFRFGPMVSLKTFYRGKEPDRPVAQFFDRITGYFSVGFRWSVGRSVEGSVRWSSVRCPASVDISHIIYNTFCRHLRKKVLQFYGEYSWLNIIQCLII